MEAIVRVRDVESVESRSGNTRYVLTDEDGNEYVTFRPEIGKRAAEFRGKHARIEYHEAQRGNYRNVYLDAIEPAPREDGYGEADQEVDEVAWKTAIDAAPWLLGKDPPKREVPPDEFFEKLKPFKELVAEDIKAPEEPEPDAE